MLKREKSLEEIIKEKNVRLGQYIACLRNEKGWSEQVLADKTGLSRNTIVDIESGKGNPTHSTLCKLENCLNAQFVIRSSESNNLLPILEEKLADVDPKLRNVILKTAITAAEEIKRLHTY